MRLLHTAFVVALALSFSATARAQDLTATHARALEDSLREFGVRMKDLLRARDTERVIALYGRPDTFVHLENGHIMTWPALESAMRTYFSSVRENDVDIVGAPVVQLLDRNHAVLYMTHRFTPSAGYAGRGGHEGVWTGVLERLDGKWRIVHSHSSDNPAPRASP
jgi:hypothetical protein